MGKDRETPLPRAQTPLVRVCTPLQRRAGAKIWQMLLLRGRRGRRAGGQERQVGKWASEQVGR